MGFCESLFGDKKPKQNSNLNQPIYVEQKKPNKTKNDDEKSNDTMKYQKCFDESFDSGINKKNNEDISIEEKENSTNNTYINKEKGQLNKSNQLNDSNQLNISKKQNFDNFSCQKDFSSNQTSTPLDNNNIINNINQNRFNISCTPKQKNNQMNISVKNYNLNSSSYMSNFINKENSISFNPNNSNIINVSLHESRFGKSAYMNIPKQDGQTFSSFNNLTESQLLNLNS